MSERFDRIKKHLKENKKVYIVGGVGIIVGAVGALVLTRGDVKLTMDSWKAIEIKWRSPTTNIMQTVLERRGHPGNDVRCLETGTKYASANHAAQTLGLSASNLSRHLSGHLPHVKGYHFEILGEAIPA